MPKINTPINLKSFRVLTQGVTQEEVEQQLRENLAWITREQEAYYSSDDSQDMIQKILTENIRLTGSLNSLGRALGIGPSTPAVYNAYNLAEMFRAVIISKIGLSAQQTALANVIMEINDPNTSNVMSAMAQEYPSLKRLPYQYVKRSLDRILTKGTLDPLPSPSMILPFWATDTHYSKVSRSGRLVFFSFKVQSRGMVTLEFSLPKSQRFDGDKVSRPTVYTDMRGRLVFGFTIEKTVPSPPTPNAIMGVDLGRKVPFTAVLVNQSGGYSQPILPNRRVNSLSQKITRLEHLGALLWSKEQVNIERGHIKKADVLRTERIRVRSKKTRLILQRSQQVARQITIIAQTHNALIALENLSWVPHSKWEQSMTQENITHASKTRSVKTRKINPKNTSQECATCGKQVTHSKRSTKCHSCAKTLDRDILASRNIAIKAQANLTHYSPITTRLPGPASTTGKTTNYDPLTRLVT